MKEDPKPAVLQAQGVQNELSRKSVLASWRSSCSGPDGRGRHSALKRCRCARPCMAPHEISMPACLAIWTIQENKSLNAITAYLVTTKHGTELRLCSHM